jgi:HSP20 family protein
MAKNVAQTGRKDIAQEQSSSVAAERERIYSQPPVDIFEDSRGITVLADLPGVNREGLGVHVEGDTLLIEGSSDLALPQGTRPVYAEQRSLNFRRRFSLSGDLDTAAIDASLVNGVLTVRIPKTAAAQPRRIEVKAG